MKIVLQKYISESGYCSRRKAEEMIRDGKIHVLVNGERAELGMRVDEMDEVWIGDEEIKKEKKVYLKLNKPVDYVCTNKSFKDELSVFDLLPRKYRRSLHVVGRLDKDSCGLVILTNDGEFTQEATNPKFQHSKRYIVRTNIKEKDVGEVLKTFKKGLEITVNEEVFFVRVKNVKYFGDGVFEIFLTEGKKRQIRKMFGAFKIGVIDLKRVAIMDYELRDLAEGEWEFFER